MVGREVKDFMNLSDFKGVIYYCFYYVFECVVLKIVELVNVV